MQNTNVTSETLQSTSAETTQDNSNFSKVQPVDNTPFATVEYEGKYYLALAHYLCSEPKKSHEDAKNSIPLDLTNEQWQALIGIINALHGAMRDYFEQKARVKQINSL